MRKLTLAAIVVALCSFMAMSANYTKANSGRVKKAQKEAQSAKECLNPGKNPGNDLEFPVGEKGTICDDRRYGNLKKADPDRAMSKVFPYLNNACSKETEQMLYIVQKENGTDFSLSRADSGHGTKDSVRGDIEKPGNDDLVVAMIHNHPSGTPWPSEEDVKSALKAECNCYIRTCDEKNGDRLYVFDVSDGKVYPISKTGKRGKKALKQYQLQKMRRNDGHDLYDMSKYDEMKALYAPKKHKESGYCECSNPQVYGHGAYVGRLYKSKYKTQHIGQIGFVCIACGCPIKSLQEKAKVWKSYQQSEGLPTQWYELQLQYVEGMKNQR